MDIHIDWDPAKARTNQRKHGVSFYEAADVFNDPLALTVIDGDHQDKEERWVTLGQVGDRRLVVVIHTWVELAINRVNVRIISARPATLYEIKQYEG